MFIALVLRAVTHRFRQVMGQRKIAVFSQVNNCSGDGKRLVCQHILPSDWRRGELGISLRADGLKRQNDR
jgi:hypothetical protein